MTTLTSAEGLARKGCRAVLSTAVVVSVCVFVRSEGWVVRRNRLKQQIETRYVHFFCHERFFRF